MTVLIDTVPAATAPAPVPYVATPQARLRRIGLGAAVVVGAAVSAAGFATTVWESGSEKIDYLNSLNVHPLQSQIAATLLHFGYMMFVPALMILGAMTRGRRSPIASIGIGIGYIGAVSLPGLLVTDFYDLAIRQKLDDATAVSVSDQAGSYPLVAAMMVPTMLALLIGLITAMVAAARARWIPWYLVPVFVLGFLAPALLSDQGWFVNTVPTSVALAALAFVGVRALRMSDREFATGLHD